MFFSEIKSKAGKLTLEPFGERPTTTTVPPGRINSQACSIVSRFPSTSKAQSTPSYSRSMQIPHLLKNLERRRAPKKLVPQILEELTYVGQWNLFFFYRPSKSRQCVFNHTMIFSGGAYVRFLSSRGSYRYCLCIYAIEIALIHL